MDVLRTPDWPRRCRQWTLAYAVPVVPEDVDIIDWCPQVRWFTVDMIPTRIRFLQEEWKVDQGHTCTLRADLYLRWVLEVVGGLTSISRQLTVAEECCHLW